MAATAQSAPTGQQIADLAYAHPPIQPADMGLAIVILSYILLVLGFLVVSARIFVCMNFSVEGNKASRWGWHDFFAILGYLFYIPAGAFAILSTYYGNGAKDDKIDDLLKIRAAEYFIYFEITYFFASTATKFAIAFTTLRICVERKYYWVIIINVAVMLAVMVFCLGLGLGNCKPLPATWNPLLGTCAWDDGFIFVSYFGSVFQVITDWISAAVPFLIIRKLQMARRVKISVMLILCVGALASIAVTIRCFYYKYYDIKKYPNNYLFHLGISIFLSMAECGLGIIACSLPSLRRLFYWYFDTPSVQPADDSGHLTIGQRSGRSGFSSGNKSARNGRSQLTWNRIDDEEWVSNDAMELEIQTVISQRRSEPVPAAAALPKTDRALVHPYMTAWEEPQDAPKASPRPSSPGTPHSLFVFPSATANRSPAK